jgi:hypothetical protein
MHLSVGEHLIGAVCQCAYVRSERAIVFGSLEREMAGVWFSTMPVKSAPFKLSWTADDPIGIDDDSA